MKHFFTFFVLFAIQQVTQAQFNLTAQDWYLPYLENSFTAEDQVQGGNYTVMDFNGDGKPDLIDAQDHTDGESWNNGTNSYWKVYLNTGSGFSSTAQDWYLPYLENSFAAEDQVQGANYTVMDFDGDGKPDLIDAQDHTDGESWNNGSFSYWKVYLNTGSGFSTTAQNWTLPYLENSFAAEDQVQGANYTVMDFNGDGKPDLIDAQDHTDGESWNDGTNSYWKVYLNTGSGFSSTAQNWTLPYLENTFAQEDQVQGINYTVMDFNGDGKPDLIDAQDHTDGESWNNGTNSYWKVYLNTGSGFSSNAQNWFLPYLENTFAQEDQVQGINYTVMDFNGDYKPDLIDAQDHTDGESWNNGSFSYWKVYMNSGTAFASAADNWDLPYLENSFTAEDQVQGTNYTVMDFNGDGSPDLIDAQDHTDGESWNNGTFSYWKVYLNTNITVNPSEIEENKIAADINLYPNPATDWISVQSDTEIQKIEIIDLSGKSLLVLSEDVNDQIDVSGFERGTYCILVSTPNGVFSEKFIKM